MGKNPARLKLHAGKNWRDSHELGLRVDLCRCGRGPKTRFVQTPDAGVDLDGQCSTVHCCAACAESIEQALQEELDSTSVIVQARAILQLASCGIEGVADGDGDVLVTVVFIALATNNDLVTRDRQVDADVIDPTFPLMDHRQTRRG